MDFVLTNAELVGGAVVALGLIAYALVTKQWAMLRLAAYQLMLSAERLMATGEGKAKFEAVFNQLWELIPAWIKKFVSRPTLKKKLQDWYNIAKDMIKDAAAAGAGSAT